MILLKPLFLGCGVLAAVRAGVGDGEARPQLGPRQNPTPSVLFRGDQRSPQRILKEGGFLPWGSPSASEGGYSVYSHMDGFQGAPKDSVYVSTTTDSKIAVKALGNRGGYVYEIHPTENMFSLESALKSHQKYPNQKEYVALRGVRSDQIIRYAKVKPTQAKAGNKPEVVLEFKDFKGYSKTKWTGHSVSNGQRPLAGLPSNHPALKDDPFFKNQIGKRPSEAAEQLLAEAKGKGWEPPAWRSKGSCVLFRRGFGTDGCWDGNNGGDADKLAKEKSGKQPSPARPESKLDPHAQAKRINKAKGYGDLEAPKYAKLLKLDKIYLEKLPELRRALGKLKASGKRISARILGGTFGSIATGIGMGLLTAEIIEEIQAGANPEKLALIVASIVPVLGCAVQALQDIKAKSLNIVDTGLCFLADLFLLTPVPVIGMVIHGLRAAISILSDELTFFHYIFQGSIAFQQSIHDKHLEQWHEHRGKVLEFIGSENFTSYWTVLWDTQRLSLVDESSEVHGALRLAAEESASETSTPKRHIHAREDEALDSHYEEISEELCNVVSSAKKTFLDRVQEEIKIMFERQYAEFDYHFFENLRKEKDWIRDPIQYVKERYKREPSVHGLQPGPMVDPFIRDYMVYLEKYLATCSSPEPPQLQRYDFYQWDKENVRELLKDHRGYKRRSGHDCLSNATPKNLRDSTVIHVFGTSHPRSDVCICLGDNIYEEWKGKCRPPCKSGEEYLDGSCRTVFTLMAA